MPIPRSRLDVMVAVRLCWMMALVAIVSQAASPAIGAASPVDVPAETQGHTDRLAFQAWIDGLAAAERRGAEFWASERSKAKPISCDSVILVGSDWLRGCRDAQRQLALLDVRRRLEPEYRKGWNAPIVDTTGTWLPGPSANPMQPVVVPPPSPAAQVDVPVPPRSRQPVHVTEATFDAAADCLMRCQVVQVKYGSVPPGLLLPPEFKELLKTGAWRTRFLELLSNLPPEFMAYGVVRPGEFPGLTMGGSLVETIVWNGGPLYIYAFVGLPEGLPPRRPDGSIYVIADPKDGSMAGIWNGADDLGQYRFAGPTDKLPPLLAFWVAGEAQGEKEFIASPIYRPGPVVLPLPSDRVPYTKERLDYLAALLENGEIKGARSQFYKGKLLRAAADASRPHWYAIEVNGKRCIDGVSPAQQIEDIRGTGWQARTKDTNDETGKLVQVEITHDEGLTTVTRTVYTSLAACEADLTKRNAIPDRYR